MLHTLETICHQIVRHFPLLGRRAVCRVLKSGRLGPSRTDHLYPHSTRTFGARGGHVCVKFACGWAARMVWRLRTELVKNP